MSRIKLAELANNVTTKGDFISFVRSIAETARETPSTLENATLSSFLEGLAGWTEDMDGYYKNRNLAVPPTLDWRLMAEMLMAATIYE